MNILLIAGFLGSGKTRFIKAMSHACRRQFVVVENEFGEMNLDAPMLRQNAEAEAAAEAEEARKAAPDGKKLRSKEEEEALRNMKVWELTEGCICCSMNLDFTHSVLTIANSLEPDYLLVEPSGVAMPGRIIQNLRRIQYDRIRLLKPVVIVDAEHYPAYRRDFPDYFRDQVASAGTIILSRSEHLCEEDFRRIGRDIGVRPDCFFPLSHYETWPRDNWFRFLEDYDPEALKFMEKEHNNAYAVPAHGPIEYEHDGHGHADSTHGHAKGHGAAVSDTDPMGEMEHIGYRPSPFENPAQLIARLHTLLSGRVGRIYRAKGYFLCGGETLYFDLVDRTYNVLAINPMPDSRLVVIGRNLNRAGLDALFGEKKLSGREMQEAQDRLFPGR